MQPKCLALKCYAQTIMNLPAVPCTSPRRGGGSALCQVRQLASKWQRLATQLRAQRAAEAMGVSNSGLIEMQFLSRVMVPLS